MTLGIPDRPVRYDSRAGAQGRKVDPMYLYTEANENLQAYALASLAAAEVISHFGARPEADLRALIAA